MEPAGSRWLPDGRGGVRYSFDGRFPRRGCGGQRGARTHLTSFSFTVSRCGAPSSSVTSVPLVPPSARSACPQGARRISPQGGRDIRSAAKPRTAVQRKAAEPPTAAQSLRAPRAVVGADVFIGPLLKLSSPTGPAAAKREAVQCDDYPDAIGTIRHGTAVSTSQKMIACPKTRQNRSRHRYADPRRARRAAAPERAQAPFSLTPGAARSLFGQNQKENGGRICQPSAWLFPRPMGQHFNEPIMTRSGDEVAAPIVRRNEIVSQRPYRGISSMV